MMKKTYQNNVKSKLNETDLVGERSKKNMQFSFGNSNNSDMPSLSPMKNNAPRTTAVTVESAEEVTNSYPLSQNG